MPDDYMHDWLIEKTRHAVQALAGIAEYVNTIPDYREMDANGYPTRESGLAGDLHDALGNATKLLAYQSNMDWTPKDSDLIMKQGRVGYDQLCKRYGVYGPEDMFPLPVLPTDDPSPLGSLDAMEPHWSFATFDEQRPLRDSVTWRDAIFDEAQQRLSLTNAFEQTLRYALYPKGWLLISGPHGAGKSHLAGAMIRRVLEAERTARYLPAPDLRGRYTRADDPVWLEARSLLETTELLVLDNVNIGYHLVGDSYLEHILQARCRDRRPTVLIAVGRSELPVWIRDIVTEITLVASDYRLLLRR